MSLQRPSGGHRLNQWDEIAKERSRNAGHESGIDLAGRVFIWATLVGLFMLIFLLTHWNLTR